MILRTSAQFHADFPDDTIENEHDIVQFGGRNVAEAIGEILKGFGYGVEPPEYAGEHGWEFSIKAGKRRIWFQITMGDPAFLLMTQDTGIFSRGRPENRRLLAEILTRLHDALASDSRFDRIFWYHDDELAFHELGNGAPAPLSEGP
jgi:hypothetical protein